MNSAPPALLALLLVCSVPAMTVVAAGPVDRGVDDHNQERYQAPFQQATPVDTADTTNRLELSGEMRSGHAAYGYDLGTALAADDDKLRLDHAQYALLDDEFEGATSEERAALIDRTYDQLQERIAALETREQNVAQQHATGEASDGELLQAMFRNTNEATAIDNALVDLRDRASSIPGYSLSSQQFRADRTVLDLHQSSIRATLDAPAAPGQTILIETAESGYSLAMLSGDTYVVETVRFDNRDADGPDQFEEFEAADRTGELYPWADRQSDPHFQDNSAENIYWTEYLHDQGSLEVYLDGSTGDVYREVQELSTSALPQLESQTWEENGLELMLNQTAANGPAELTVTDSETGEPEVATITIGTNEIGDTDDDGTRWIIPPTGEYELTVETADGVFNATVSS